MPHQCTSCGYLFDDGSKEMLRGCPDCGGNTFQFHPKGASIPEVPTEQPPDPEGGTVGETVGRATNKVRGMFGGGPAGAPDEDTTGPTDTADPAGTADTAGTVDDRPDPDAPWPDDESSSTTAPGSASSEPTVAGGSESSERHEPPTRESESEHHESETPDPEAYGHDAEVERRTPRPSSTPTSSPREDSDDDLIDADAREGNTPEDAAQASARTEFVTPDELPPRAQSEGDAAEVDRPRPKDGRIVREPTGRRPSIEELREELNDQFESIKILEPGQYELNLMELYNREEYVIALQENGRYVIQMPDNWIRDRQSD